MENNPAQLLMNEHEVIKQVEKTVYLLDFLWEKDAEKYKSFIAKIIYFLKEYSDKYHHHKEEEILFPELCNHPDFLLQEIIDELLEHHEMFREYTREIEEAIADNQFENAHTILKKYLENLLDHIAIENDELFIMAENLFSPNELEKLFFRFKDIDMELGEAIKTDLEKIPADIEKSLEKDDKRNS